MRSERVRPLAGASTFLRGGRVSAIAALAALLTLAPPPALAKVSPLAVSPRGLNLGKLVLGVKGTTSIPASVTILNPDTKGAVPVTIAAISISGVNQGDFGIQDTQGCREKVLQPGGNCVIAVTFTPSGFGRRAAILSVTDSSGNTSKPVNLLGIGIRGLLLYHPRSLSFGRVAVGAESQPLPVLLTNNNSVSLRIDNVATSTGDFVASRNCIGELVPNSYGCQVSVSFSPKHAKSASASAKSAILTLTDDAVGSPHKVTLSGIAIVAPTPTATQPATQTSTPSATPTSAQTPTASSTPTSTSTETQTATASATATSSVKATPTATPTAVAHFGTLAPNAQLPGGAQCAQMVAASSFEPRPENTTANHTVPTSVQLQSLHMLPTFGEPIPASDFAPVDGNFTGATDMILRWGACKWGIDEDVVRSVADNESYWTAYHAGDLANSQSQCMAGGWNGWTNNSFCYQSYGIMQVRVLDYNAWPYALDSTALNVDFWGAHLRACMNGDETDLASQTPPSGFPTYPNGTTDQMLWGCVGVWFSGMWYDPGALNYISNTQSYMSGKEWLGWWTLPQPNAVSISSPKDGATVSGMVSVTASTTSSVSNADFYIDGSFVVSGPPYSFVWDTTNQVINGPHSISVNAFDGSGAMIGHNFVNVSVAN